VLQSNGKVQRKKVRPASKSSSKQRTSSVVPLTSSTQFSHEGTSPGDFPSALPQEVEQIFEVNFKRKIIVRVTHIDNIVSILHTQANTQPRQLRSPPATPADTEKGISPNDWLVMVIVI